MIYRNNAYFFIIVDNMLANSCMKFINIEHLESVIYYLIYLVLIYNNNDNNNNNI